MIGLSQSNSGGTYSACCGLSPIPGLVIAPLVAFVAKNESKGVNSGHAKASEHVCEHRNSIVLRVLSYYSPQNMCVNMGTEATKVNYFTVYNECPKFRVLDGCKTRVVN